MNRKAVHSVGIDIGTTTTQIIFSELTMVNRAPVTQVPRYEFVKREITYQSPVSRTPLTEDGLVDVDKVQAFIDEQFVTTGLTLKDIETGAIIITGETSKASNARDAIMGLANRLGDFVVATAGPNLESVIAGRGSGAGDYSKENRARVLNIDIGGGTSNYAVFDCGDVVDTACLNIGGHLIETDNIGRVTKVYPPALMVIAELFGSDYKAAQMSVGQLEEVAERMAELIVESMGSSHTALGARLLMTPALQPDHHYDAVFLSGGVGDSYYRLLSTELDDFEWRDIGVLLARALSKNSRLSGYALQKPAQTLQATVIGAGAYSLSLSGSSIWSNNDELPVRNVPIIQPYIDWTLPEPDICEQTVNAGQRMDLRLLDDRYAIAFDGNMPVSYQAVAHTAHQLASYYAEYGNRHAPAIVVTQNDLGKVLGMELQPLINPQKLLVIDEVRAREGDFIDIGESFFGGEVVPLTIKSLAFPA